jgi:hypothetical protein
MFFDRTTQNFQQHKFNSIEILDKHKMLPKRKAQMNIPLCMMIYMLVIHPTFKIDVLKMEPTFSIGYYEGR